jgi:hypothetical protein
MTMITWIGAVVASLLAGATAGWWFVSRIMTRQFKAKLHRATEAIKQQHAASDDRLRAAHTRATLELEQVKAGVPRQIATATSEARARIARLEEQLKMTQLELDKMRIRVEGADADRREYGGDGFAPTQSFGATR